MGLIPLLPPELTRKHHLDAGDVSFFGYGPDGPLTMPIGIEYKTVGDALTCMKDGRLTGGQLPAMSKVYQRVYLIIEGSIRANPQGILERMVWKSGKPVWTSYGSSITYRMFDNWLNGLTEIGHVVVKRVLDRNEAAEQVLNLYRYWTRDYASHRSLFSFNKSQLPLQLEQPSTLRLMAAQIPRIGWELSKRAEDEFDSPHDMITSEAARWEKIHGIGKKKAQSVVEILRRSKKSSIH